LARWLHQQANPTPSHKRIISSLTSFYYSYVSSRLFVNLLALLTHNTDKGKGEHALQTRANWNGV
jgi:hypothetical protein